MLGQGQRRRQGEGSGAELITYKAASISCRAAQRTEQRMLISMCCYYLCVCVAECLCAGLINFNTFSLGSHILSYLFYLSLSLRTGDNPAAMYHGHVGGSTKTTQRQLHNLMVIIAIGYRIFHTSVYMKIV